MDGAVRHIDTADLSIACQEFGDPGGPVALLLHGWPDDASTWARVAPEVAAAGLHVVVPTHRGFGTTRFHNDDTPRTGNTAMLAMDVTTLMDALGIECFSVAGHDWGANIAEALAVGWPDRVERITMLSTPPRLGGLSTPPFWHAQRQWYHWFQATARGADAVRADPKGFAHIMWENWAPAGWFDEETFTTVSKSFENPDWVDVTLHSYQSRWDEAEPDPQSVWLDEKIKTTRTLSLPAIFVQGEADGVNPPKASEKVADKFTGPFERITLAGVGHFPQREAPAAVAAILRAFFAGERPVANVDHMYGARTRLGGRRL